MNDNSGVSVSTAGDVNGDGLDDLIVGSAYEVQLNGISKAGTGPPSANNQIIQAIAVNIACGGD
jgi:hypothetical protein